jgi:hypothetical protein
MMLEGVKSLIQVFEFEEKVTSLNMMLYPQDLETYSSLGVYFMVNLLMVFSEDKLYTVSVAKLFKGT